MKHCIDRYAWKFTDQELYIDVGQHAPFFRRKNYSTLQQDGPAEVSMSTKAAILQSGFSLWKI
jgi:hypothetical protein